MYKVLLVDDEYMILEGLKQLIPWEELGFEVVKTAKRAQEALDYLKDNQVDVLVTDVTMPKMTGIELVKEVRKERPNLPVLILSGYQEFEYVKQGIELGIKGYLVKPINKEELKEKIILIKSEIEENQKRHSQKQLYFETYIQKWLNDEMNEDEFIQFLKETEWPVSSNYAVIIMNQKQRSEELQMYLKESKQPFIIENELNDLVQTVIIYRGSQVGLTIFIKAIEKTMVQKEFTLALGELVSEWDNVYESYEKAKKLLEFQEFYGSDGVSQTINVTQLDEKEGLHFLSFNKALIIGDITTIKEELENVYKQMEDFLYAPENVRYVTFLLFTDIYRHFPTINKERYDETIDKIHSSLSMNELKEWLMYILETIEGNSDSGKRYSSLVKSVIDIITEKYQEDLSLKSVAEMLHVNSVYLGQLFKKETERSFSQFLNQTRIKKAQFELLHTDKSINEVGYDMGYNNPTYFFKMFRKLNGITPKEFREKYLVNYQEL